MVLTSLTPHEKPTVPHLTTHPISRAQNSGDRNGDAYGSLQAHLIPSKNLEPKEAGANTNLTAQRKKLRPKKFPRLVRNKIIGKTEKWPRSLSKWKAVDRCPRNKCSSSKGGTFSASAQVPW